MRGAPVGRIASRAQTRAVSSTIGGGTRLNSGHEQREITLYWMPS